MADREIHLLTEVWRICEKHDAPYPKGDECPACASAKTTDTKGACNTNSPR